MENIYHEKKKECQVNLCYRKKKLKEIFIKFINIERIFLTD